MIKLAAFLGNPGKQYAGNRHNAGWLLAQKMPFYDSLFWQKKFKGLYAVLDSARVFSAQSADISPNDDTPEKFHFLTPETFMNLSGESVFAAASFFRIKPDEILIVHDELEIPLGTVSLKFSGGLGGHNGLRSMKACFGTADFWRLRIGIGRPAHDDISLFVLSDFTAAEKEILHPALDAASSLLTRCLARKPETLMGEWAKKKIITDAAPESGCLNQAKE